jgi:hypothetical protein
MKFLNTLSMRRGQGDRLIRQGVGREYFVEYWWTRRDRVVNSINAIPFSVKDSQPKILCDLTFESCNVKASSERTQGPSRP